jgi:hypothetical protein
MLTLSTVSTIMDVIISDALRWNSLANWSLSSLAIASSFVRNCCSICGGSDDDDETAPAVADGDDGDIGENGDSAIIPFVVYSTDGSPGPGLAALYVRLVPAVLG